MAETGELWVVRLGTVAYAEATELQEQVREARQHGRIPDVLLLLEHPPVYTKGRRTGAGELPMDAAWYAEQGIEIVEADRGGQVTYHGPGQLVGYPIVRLRASGESGAGLGIDVREYVARMETAMIEGLGDVGVQAHVQDDLTGVWAGAAKIGSIGVHVSRGVTTHGFAVNVDNDLRPFGWIVPCGIHDARVTSVAAETAKTDAIGCFSKAVAWRLAQRLGLRQRLVSAERLAEASRPLISTGA